MYGACYDGHIHGIEPQYVIVALKKKNYFRSYMFKKTIVTEAEIPAGKFIRLPATNCPSSFHFPFQLNYKISNGFRSHPVYAPLEPFRGDSDTRTGSAFLISFENHIDREKNPKWVNAMQLLNLLKESLPKDNDIQHMMRYADLRQEFLSRFWSLEKQFEVYSKFLKSSYPMFENQKVSEYVEYWTKQMERNTILLTHEFVDNIINRVPVRYAMRLVRYAERVIKICEIIGIIKACESDLCLVERIGWR